MARKTIASQGSKLGWNDQSAGDGCVKYVCNFPEKHFFVPLLDAEGKAVYATDAGGNNKSKQVKLFSFVPVRAQKDYKGVIDTRSACCFFIVDPVALGVYAASVKKLLDDELKNPSNKLFLEDDHFRQRNPEAFGVAKRTAELEDKLAAAERRAAELEQKLGFKKQQ